jgi:hypothetical protein
MDYRRAGRDLQVVRGGPTDSVMGCLERSLERQSSGQRLYSSARGAMPHGGFMRRVSGGVSAQKMQGRGCDMARQIMPAGLDPTLVPLGAVTSCTSFGFAVLGVLKNVQACWQIICCRACRCAKGGMLSGPGGQASPMRDSHHSRSFLPLTNAQISSNLPLGLQPVHRHVGKPIRPERAMLGQRILIVW